MCDSFAVSTHWGENHLLGEDYPPPVSTLARARLCVTVIYIPLMLFGLLGNILTILVVWLRPHMRTSTYLYLSSMAVSDLLILLLLPLDLYKLWRPRPWPLGDLACKLTMFLSECCTFCTILHITFLSLERYLAVCWPITAKTVVTRRRTRAIIGCLWLSAAVSAAPVLVMVGVEDLHYDHTYNDTVFSDTYAPPDTHLYFLYYLSQYFNLVSSVLFYLSAAVNPLLYNLMSARYRHAVRSLIRTQSHAQARRMHTLTVHHSTTTL
uniref:Growth hormone secretagogue receptor type 1 n=1 Tax=Maylandia zebra TaxID=106582 RepID=A0A3P9DEX5_9CICH